MKFYVKAFIRNINKRKGLLKRYGIDNLQANEWLPIRRWSKARGIPFRCEIKNNELWADMEGVENFKIRTKGRLSKYWRGSQEGISGNIPYFIKGNRIWVRMVFKWYMKFKPKEFRIRDGYIWCKVPTNFIAVWYKSKRINGIGRSATTISRCIKIDKMFLQGLGLLQGEMSKFGRGFEFSNSNNTILNTVFGFLKKFNILPIDCKVQLLISSRGISKDESLRQRLDQKFKKYWYKELYIPLENFNKTTWRNDKRATVKNGNVRIIYSNNTFSILISLILNHFKNLIEKNNEFAKYYSQGLFAAEGCAYLKWDYTLTSLILGAKEKNDREHYSTCLKLIGITSRNKEKGLWIKGWENFYKLFKIRCFELHPKRETNFLYGFLNCKYSQLYLQLKHFLVSSQIIQEHMKRTGLSCCGAQYSLNRLVDLGFLTRENPGTKHKPYRYTITNLGYEIIKELLQNERELKRLKQHLNLRNMKGKYKLIYNSLPEGKISATDVAKILNIKRNHASRILAYLHRNGMIRRFRSIIRKGNRNFSGVLYQKI